MHRPTIPDLAMAAGVSVATVNRVLSGGVRVRAETVQHVLQAAERIGFYGTGVIKGRLVAARPKYRFGILLQQPGRSFYVALEQAIRAEAAAQTDAVITLNIEYLEELSPEYISSRMLALGAKSDAIAVIAAEHPLLTTAIESLAAEGVPTFALVTQLMAACGVHYVGLDNWKVGRTAAWAFHRLCKAPGKIGILVGNHRYRCQEQNESGFRSYFREHGPEFTLLEPISTYESATIAREVTQGVLRDNPDLAGLYIAGGGLTGALAALRAEPPGPEFVAVSHEYLRETRDALVDGTLAFVIAHPVPRLIQELLSGMRQALAGKEPAGGIQNRVIAFDLFTRENV